MRFTVFMSMDMSVNKCFSFTYTEAKVQQEEDVERHVDLQREVFVEVLTGLNRTVRGRKKINISNYCRVKKGINSFP